MSLIEKTINYCWFGRQPLTDLAKKCVASWDRYLPDYKKILWNEDNFDIDANPFTKEAYACKKHAFVSDFVRLYVLYHNGGIYMDTDVEAIKGLDEFLDYPAFSGFENQSYLQSGILGAVPQHPWIKRFFDHYKDRSFFRDDGTMELVANVRFMTRISQQEYGLIVNNREQVLKDGVHIFPNDYFCPMVWETREIKLTQNTHTIHHFAYSWQEPGVNP